MVGIACCDRSKNGDRDGAVTCKAGTECLSMDAQAEGPCLARDAGNVVLGFERLEVAHNGIGAFKIEMSLNVTNARPIGIFFKMGLNVVK